MNSNKNSDSKWQEPTNYTVRFIPFYDHADKSVVQPSGDEAMDCDDMGISQQVNLTLKKMPPKGITATSPPAVPPPPPTSPPPSSAPAISPDNIFEDYGLAHPPSCPPVTFHMIILNEIVLSKVDPDKVLVKMDSFTIFQKDLASYSPGRGRMHWLEDKAVDFYLHMIQKRCGTDPEKYAKIYAFPAYLYEMLAVAKGLENVKQTADENIFNYELIFFPVCWRSHWRLVVADVKKKTVSAYNSIDSSPCLLIVKNIRRYLNYEYTKQYNVKEAPEWSLYPDAKTPQQCNSDDCGVYTLQFADYLSRRKDFDFEQKHMIYFRAKMLYESITGRLLPMPN